VQFLADMGVHLDVVEWLRGQGHDAKHLREEGLQRLPDEEIFAKAVTEQRVVLTFDLDFGEIAALSPGPVASVIVFRLLNARAAKVIQRLAVVLPAVLPALEQGAIITVEESRHRVRRLPIGGAGDRP
jgi:predicted nuclease of predicted toxin-antitoxin system